ncbi:28S ribosomal protein S29, mitochondrial-like [Daphnia pulex]|uniref:Small ribosomal subunit protein mS29 n=2 Tax=Daphnia TaxID=6668 RepID=A0A4Y7MTA9_DAPPU|nr:28S ribosomal protein S29, mitochondrial-like [Daphnia pulex]SVE84244.1 EOG090X05V1 [Daphnia pulex]
MMRYSRTCNIFRVWRRFSSISAESVPVTESITNDIFRTNESNPVNHRVEHNSRFYSISEPVKKQLFAGGGLPKEYQSLSETLNGLCIMVRKPAIELIHYLNKTNFDAPVLRYVLYGKTGVGKSLSLAHIVHYGSSAGFVLVHVPWVPKWFQYVKVATPSSVHANKYDQPIEAVEWLKHFSTQNGHLLDKLELKTSNTYTWSKREVTAEGSPLSELIDLGLNRAKYATGCIVALLDELKKAASSKQCRVLVVIDGFNSFFSRKSNVIREDKSMVLPSDFLLTDALLSLTRNDWNNGAVVVSVDPSAHPPELRESPLPRYLLGKTGFEHLDPFVPIEVQNYNDKEFRSQIDYYIERNWLQQPKARTDNGRAELSFTSGKHPYSLMRLVAPY